ncbi:rhodanese-like domain-containing protein [Rhodococcus sp. ACT016]|uniref:rhodanese-like domain-containing protein n=1 Tax=Rhodococcus sp. ACT016 TaxID=3134808 RepID=UPI003D294A36
MTIPHVPTVSVTDLPAERTEATVLLDVREDDEWELGHAPGAQHIPIVDVPARTDEIDIDAEVYVVCRQGGRSIVAVEYLNSIGFDAYHVAGGMVAWQSAGLPLTSDGDPGSAKIY